MVVSLGKIKGIKLKYGFTHENFFSVLLGLIWADNTLINYFKAFLGRFPYIYNIREHIMTSIFILILILSLPYILKHINSKIIVAYLVVVGVYLLNIIIFPNNQAALEKNMIPFLIKSLPMVFIGAAVDLKRDYKMLYYISLISVIIRVFHLMVAPNNVIYGDLFSSYLLLPHVCMVIAATFEKRSIINIVTSILGTFTIFAFGSRGPILCLFSLIIVYAVVFKKVYKNIWLFGILAILSLCIMFLYDEITQLLLLLTKQMGMSTRVFDMMMSGDILNSSGRDVIQRTLLEAVSRNWFGYGIAGDRALVGVYSHNILIELWISYGVFAGTALFAAFVYITLKLLNQKSHNYAAEDGFILVLISSCFVKLFLSSSYLTEPLLFLLIGIILTEYKKCV